MALPPKAFEPVGVVFIVGSILAPGMAEALEYARSGDLAAARRLSNPENAPHLELIDMGGHGYSAVTAGTRPAMLQQVIGGDVGLAI